MRRAQPSGAHLPGVHGTGGHQHARQDVLRLEGCGRQRHWRHRRQCALAGRVERAARRPDAGRPPARDRGCHGVCGAVGLTTNVDMGAFNLPGTPDLQGSFEADTLASADQGRMYDAVVGPACARRHDHAGAHLLPDDGHAARRAHALGAAAQHTRRLRRRHAAHLGHRRVRDQLAALWPEAADQLRARAGGHRQGRMGVPAAQPLGRRGRADGQHVRGREQSTPIATCGGRWPTPARPTRPRSRG